MVALVLGLVTAKVGTDMLKKYRGNTGAGVQIVTAKKDMEPGYVIEAADVQLAEVSPRLVPAKAVKELKEVVGRTVITSVTTGQPMFDGLLAPPGSGAGFQAMIPAGMRAVTVDVSESSAVAGMLMPGCKVDVISTMRRGDQTIAKAIVENVKVSYVQRARSGYSSKSGPVENGPVKTVTLLVTPKQANTIELANASGSKPRLVLRSNADTGSGNSEMSSNELMGIKDEPEVVVVEAPPAADDPTFENVKPEPPPVNRPSALILRGSQESTIYFDENSNGKEEGKKEAGDGTTPTATKAPPGEERRTDTGKAPESSSPRTEAR